MAWWRRGAKRPRDVSLRYTLGILVTGRRIRLGMLVAASFVEGLLEAGALYFLSAISLAITRGDESVDLPAGLGHKPIGTVITFTAVLVAIRFFFMLYGAWQ